VRWWTGLGRPKGGGCQVAGARPTLACGADVLLLPTLAAAVASASSSAASATSSMDTLPDGGEPVLMEGGQQQLSSEAAVRMSTAAAVRSSSRQQHVSQPGICRRQVLRAAAAPGIQVVQVLPWQSRPSGSAAAGANAAARSAGGAAGRSPSTPRDGALALVQDLSLQVARPLLLLLCQAWLVHPVQSHGITESAAARPTACLTAPSAGNACAVAAWVPWGLL